MLIRFVFLLMLLPGVAWSKSPFCITQYKSDFAFAQESYTVDAVNGITAEVRWGPHGYVGAILLPREGQRDRVPLEQFETFYRSFNCQWSSVQELWNDSLEQIASRKNCTAMVSGGAEASYMCEGRSVSYRLGEDALGPFQEYVLKGSGPWYQTEAYYEAKKRLEELKQQAVHDAFHSVTTAFSLSKCEADLQPETAELPDFHSQDLPTHSPKEVEATIEFTVGTDGSVSEIFMKETASYGLEYSLAWAARKSIYPAREQPCRRTWVYRYSAAQ